ncbi:MAG: phosphatidate cytidylyltransferase [Deltaproteobacteria bacterium]|nr:phosphatidate cytidylyltransferase [Deltaproteobacteria bacterium]
MIDPRQWGSHRQRLVTSIFMAIPVAALLALGPYWGWALVVMVLSALGLWELQGLFFPAGLTMAGKVHFVVTGSLIPFCAAVGGVGWLHAALVAILFVSLVLILFLSPLDPGGIPRLALFQFGWLYIPYLLSYVLLIGDVEGGRRWVFFALLVTAAGDIGAYYCGRFFGRRKLYEAVSPKKTWEGSAGGLTAAIACGVIYGTLCIQSTTLVAVTLLSALLAVVGQLGDLIESMIKRVSGRKDSSRLIPGHGGILDRMDSLLFVFPCLWVYLHWMP